MNMQTIKYINAACRLWTFILLVSTGTSLMSQAQNSEGADSLVYKRRVLMSEVLQKGVRVKKKNFEELLKDNPKALKNYRLGSYIRPLGPLVSIGGIGLCYVAIKGKPASAVVEGTVHNYTIRSLPLLVAGVGAFMGGICIIEFSHELQSNAVKAYNSSLGARKTTLLQKTKFGITPTGNLGFYARF